jgi:hypothetical protein
MIEIQTKNGVFILPINGFYIVDGYLLCNIFTGATLGSLKEFELEKIKAAIGV